MMEANIMLEALADAYRMAQLERNTYAQELAKCQEELKKLQVIVGSIAPSSLEGETSSKSNTKSQESPKKSAKPVAKKGGARKK